MIRRLVFGAFVIGAVLLGLVAQAGSHLLALTTPTARAEIAPDAETPFGVVGRYVAGVRHISADDFPTPMTVWYPAVRGNDPESTVTYAYAINMVGPDTSIALASYEGRAIPEAIADESGGPYPLVVLSSGFAITAGSYGWLAEHLASRGFLVAAPRHRESLDPGTLWESTVQRPVDVAGLMSRIEEMSRPGGELEGLVDFDRVGIVGHSYGGYTAQVAGGARLDTTAFDICETAREAEDPVTFLCDALQPRLEEMAWLTDLSAVPNGMWPDWSDSRIDAVVSIAGDAVMFGPDGLSEVEIPVMAIGGTADTDSPFEWGTRYTYEHVSSVRKVEVGLEHAGHMIFAGKCERTRRILSLVPMGFCSDPVWDRDRAHQVVSHYATAFLLAELTGDSAAEHGLAPDRQNVPDVSYRSEGY